MLHGITVKNTTWIITLREKIRQLVACIHNFKEEHKLYFIFKMLMTYERARVIIRSAISVIWSKSKEGIQRVEETLPVPPLSLEKAKNR